jgi:hypothetical protein
VIGAGKDNLGIRPLAGLGSYADVSGAGYGVDRTVMLLRRYLYVEGETERFMDEDRKLPGRDVWWDEFYGKVRNLDGHL